ncbi:MAG: LuxR C-terminal-related transcriptional regulator [Treponema sp.]|jgi:DNA-binding CsgD family transcriptional regulator|nr:LuxR C-terminal-related transcriptional regulator [Treponema sp.]
MVKHNQQLFYWRIIAIVAALAWMLVLVVDRYTISAYEKTAGGLIHPYLGLGLQGVTVIVCVVLVIFPLQFSIYAVFCCLWGLIHLIEGGSFGGILMYGLGLLFALKGEFFHTHGRVKLCLAILVLAGAVLSQIHYGFEHLYETLLDMVAIFLIALLGGLLYGREIQAQVSGEDVNEDMAGSERQKSMLLLPRSMFTQRDVKILQLVLAGNKYEGIASEQKISLSSVKKRVRVLYNHLNLPDRVSFINAYEGYAIELGIPAPKEEEAGNISQFPVPQSRGKS